MGDTLSQDIKGTLTGVGVVDGADVDIPVYLKAPRKLKYQARWLLLWNDDKTNAGGVTMYEQAISGVLSKTEMRVRDYMMCKCDFENFVHFNQSQCAKDLRIAQPNISAAIKHLIQLNIVLAGPKAGKFQTYRLNPALVYSGALSCGIAARNNIIKQARNGATVHQFPREEGR